MGKGLRLTHNDVQRKPKGCNFRDSFRGEKEVFLHPTPNKTSAYIVLVSLDQLLQGVQTNQVVQALQMEPGQVYGKQCPPRSTQPEEVAAQKQRGQWDWTLEKLCEP